MHCKLENIGEEVIMPHPNNVLSHNCL